MQEQPARTRRLWPLATRSIPEGHSSGLRHKVQQLGAMRAPAVAIQGMAYVVEMCSYLMHATGDGFNKEQRVSAADIVVRNVWSNARHLLLYHSHPFELRHSLLSPWMRHRKMARNCGYCFQLDVDAAMSRRDPAGQSDVGLLHAVALEFCSQRGLGSRAQRQNLNGMNSRLCK